MPTSSRVEQDKNIKHNYNGTIYKHYWLMMMFLKSSIKSTLNYYIHNDALAKFI